MSSIATFRFYEELNDFLPKYKKKINFSYEFERNPSVKDAIESIGVPHVEVDLILVNSRPVDFSYQLQNNDFVSVYPVFETLDIQNITRLRKKPLRNPKFVLDTHLGKLAKYLRLLGFDTLYGNYYTDGEIVKISIKQHRIILTRDIGILKYRIVTHGYWIRSQDSRKQLLEVIKRFQLQPQIKPFRRCIKCNGYIKKTSVEIAAPELLPLTRKSFREFYKCSGCGNIYWKGSHYEKMKRFIESMGK
jgi:uncharacterized protein with PIN domain